MNERRQSHECKGLLARAREESGEPRSIDAINLPRSNRRRLSATHRDHSWRIPADVGDNARALLSPRVGCSFNWASSRAIPCRSSRRIHRPCSRRTSACRSRGLCSMRSIAGWMLTASRLSYATAECKLSAGGSRVCCVGRESVAVGLEIRRASSTSTIMKRPTAPPSAKPIVSRCCRQRRPGICRPWPPRRMDADRVELHVGHNTEIRRASFRAIAARI